MEFGFTDQQEEIRHAVRKFSEAELLPNYQRWDRTGEFLTPEFTQKIVDMGSLTKKTLPKQPLPVSPFYKPLQIAIRVYTHYLDIFARDIAIKRYCDKKIILSHGCLKAKVSSYQIIIQGKQGFYKSLPWLVNRNLLLKNVNVAISFYHNIALLRAQTSSV